MSEEKSFAEQAAYNLGRYVLGPILMLFIFALPIWLLWNSTVCDIFTLLGPITYPRAFCLCATIWCFGRVWKGVPDGKS